MKKFYKLTPNEMKEAFFDCYYPTFACGIRPPAMTKKKDIKEYLVNGVFLFCHENGRFLDIAEQNGFSDYRYGNIKKTVDLIYEQNMYDIRMGFEWSE